MRRLLAAATIAFAAWAKAADSADRVMPLEVTVNGSRSGTWLLLEHGGRLYAPRDAFEEWRLQVPAETERVEFKGESYAALAAIPGFKARVDASSQSLDLLFSPQAFAASRLTRETSKVPAPSPVLPALFVNYDVSYSSSRFRDSGNVNDLGTLAEVGASTPWGVLTTSGLARNLLADSALGDARRALRLETTFTHDFPSRNLTLRVGDATTRPAMWGRDVYFGGVRFGTNFALTPGYVSQPLPALNGLSAAPSTVELYVNDVLRQVSNVPAGPFAIDNVPALTGSGEARIVVRDLLGRETVIVQSFFAASQLLAAGLDDWSVEGGAVRRDLGQASGHYGPGFASGTWRHGLSNWWTVEGRAEVSRDHALGGAGVVSAMPWQLLGKAAIAASRVDSLGAGGLWLAGIERQGTQAAFSVQAQGASRYFRQLGEDRAFVATRLQVAGNFNYATERAGTFGAGFAAIRRHDGERITTVSASFGMKIFQRSSLTFAVSRAIDGTSGTAVGLTLVVPLDGNRLATAIANTRGKQHDAYATASQNPGGETGLGWRALAGDVSDRAHAEGGVYYLGRYGTLSADASASPDQRIVRLGAGGALVYAAGHGFATRKLDQSFAVVEVPGQANVGVGLGANVLARTDENGVAFIPRLLPYHANPVRLDPSELPVSAEIDNIERIAVPAWRSAVRVQFPVRSGRGALLRIVLDDGEAAPPGATVAIDGDAQSFYVARRGEAFVTGLQPTNRLRLQWHDQACAFDVALPAAANDEIARVGPIACSGVVR